MSVKEKLKKSKKAIVMGVLSLAAAVAPIKGQAKEATPVTNDTITTTALDGAAKRRMFVDAVWRGAPKKEIAKYVDFPEFIPVTKDGQFDGKKAEEYAKTLAPYVKILVEKGETIPAAEAYKAFKETTGQKNVSLQDFEDVKAMAEDAMKKQGRAPVKGIPSTIIGLILAGVALATGATASWAVIESGRELLERRRSKKVNVDLLSGAVVLTAITGTIAFYTGKGAIGCGTCAWKEWTRTPEKSIYEIYSGTYDNYLNHTIQAQKKQFKILEWNQAKQLIQNAQGAMK